LADTIPQFSQKLLFVAKLKSIFLSSIPRSTNPTSEPIGSPPSDEIRPELKRRICFEFRQYPTIEADFYMRKKIEKNLEMSQTSINLQSNVL